MTDRKRSFDLETTQPFRARRRADGIVAQYIRELAEHRDDCGAPAEAEVESRRAATLS